MLNIGGRLWWSIIVVGGPQLYIIGFSGKHGKIAFTWEEWNDGGMA